MKQVVYGYTIDQVMATLLSDIIDIEDGYYRLSFLLETVPSTIDKINPQQRDGVYPGMILRIVGLELIRVEGPGPLTMQILDGMIVTTEELDGFDSNNSRFIESGEGPGEDSSDSGAGSSSRGGDRSYPRAFPLRPRLLR